MICLGEVVILVDDFCVKDFFWRVSQLTTSKTIKNTVAAQGNVAGFRSVFLSQFIKQPHITETFETFSTVEVGSYQDEEGGPVCKTSLGSF